MRPSIPKDKKIEIHFEISKLIHDIITKITDKNIIGPIILLTKILVMIKYIPIILK